jgi:hypothetical protein
VTGDDIAFLAVLMGLALTFVGVVGLLFVPAEVALGLLGVGLGFIGGSAVHFASDIRAKV